MNINRNEIIPHLGGNGPPCPSSWEHLSLGWGEQWLGEMEMKERESVWFESKRSQSIHKKRNNRKVRSVLRVTPHPPYIVFPRDFRVLSPWSRLVGSQQQPLHCLIEMKGDQLSFMIYLLKIIKECLQNPRF